MTISSLMFSFLGPPVLESFWGEDYLPAVLLCNSFCKQFCWNKLPLTCSLTLPAAWEMITGSYWAKQPLAMLRLDDFLVLWQICNLCVCESVCVCREQSENPSLTTVPA